MLVSPNVDHTLLFRDLRAVVVDEVHAFGSGDRGWHLLAVLERLSGVAGRPLQRIGLSATVGNPEDLLRWLQGSSAGDGGKEGFSAFDSPGANRPRLFPPSHGVPKAPP